MGCIHKIWNYEGWNLWLNFVTEFVDPVENTDILILNFPGKSVNKEELIVVGKIVEFKLNYCIIKDLENLSNFCGLQVGTEWNIEKAEEKIQIK